MGRGGCENARGIGGGASAPSANSDQGGDMLWEDTHPHALALAQTHDTYCTYTHTEAHGQAHVHAHAHAHAYAHGHRRRHRDRGRGRDRETDAGSHASKHA